jgi:stage IV sporulation protein B
MTSWQRRRWGSLGMAAMVMALAASPPVADLGRLPARWEVPSGQLVTVPWSAWLPIRVQATPGVQVVAEPTDNWAIRGETPGHYSVDLKWFGWIPFKRVPVRVLPVVRVVPGGQSIGVVAKTRGVLVTGYDPVASVRGLVDPAAEAGIEPGDVLLAVDGRPLNGDAALRTAVQVAGWHHRWLAIRDQGPRQVLTRYVRPLWNEAAHTWQIGLKVRDTASGVGTLTFWTPRQLTFAALGHSISDGVTRRPVGIAAGQLMAAAIVGIVPGTPDDPGQKVGILTPGTAIRGVVSGNGRFGLTGRLTAPPQVGPTVAVPIALPDQVHTGPATMLTALHGTAPQAFRIRILEAYPQAQPTTKGLLFEVTDPRLLRITGGVVQGMSGSPILQNGRLVGAVTHVLVSRPSLGYGCYAAWMWDALRSLAPAHNFW